MTTLHSINKNISDGERRRLRATNKQAKVAMSLPPQNRKHNTPSAAQPTDLTCIQVYIKGLRVPDTLSELRRALEAVPGLNFVVDAPHDVVFLESSQSGFSREVVRPLFTQLGLKPRFVAHRSRGAESGTRSGEHAWSRRSATPPVVHMPRRDSLHDEAVSQLEELPLYARNVATLRGLGFSFPQIARHYGVTPQAISVLLIRQRALFKPGQSLSGLVGLSPRATNCLGRLHIGTRAEAQICPDLREKLQGQRNCGEKTIEEILCWAQGDAAFPRVSARNGKAKRVAALST